MIYCNKKNYIRNNLGFITCFFLFFYGMFRILIEFTREPDAHIGLFFDAISMGQLLSIPLIITGILIYIKINNNHISRKFITINSSRISNLQSY